MASKVLPAGSFYAKDRASWRRWLQSNHRDAASVWLVIHRKSNPSPCVTYEEAVLEGLCFGWIDSKPQKLDDGAYLLFFCPRKPGSVWSASNKKRVVELIRDGLMTDAGLKTIEVAKANGSWERIDDAEALVMPADLAKALAENSAAKAYFDAFPPSAKKGIFTWISLAKTEATRRHRINETVEKAEQNIRANQWSPKS